jgi:hypothetical protein
MLVELGLVEQRYQAVLEVLNGGAPRRRRQPAARDSPRHEHPTPPSQVGRVGPNWGRFAFQRGVTVASRSQLGRPA